MKEIRAIVRPARMKELRRSLLALPDFPGMTVVSCRGVTAPGLKPETTFMEELVDYSDNVCILIVAADDQVPAIIAAIRRTATTGRLGDGVLWVTAVEHWERLASPQQ